MCTAPRQQSGWSTFFSISKEILVSRTSHNLAEDVLQVNLRLLHVVLWCYIPHNLPVSRMWCFCGVLQAGGIGHWSHGIKNEVTNTGTPISSKYAHIIREGFRLLLSMFQQAALGLNSPLPLLTLLPWLIWNDPWVPLNVGHSSVARVWNPLSMTPFHALDLPLLLCLKFLLLV